MGQQTVKLIKFVTWLFWTNLLCLFFVTWCCLNVVSPLCAAASAEPAEENSNSVASIGRECEVEKRVDHGRRIHGPLHHRLVRLRVKLEEFWQGEETTISRGPVGENVVDVEELEGSAGRLEDEDEEEGDEGEPEVGWPESSGAAASGLDEEGEPGDDEEDDRQQEGEDEGGEEEVQAWCLPPLAEAVHANLRIIRPAPEHVVLIGVHLDVIQLWEECRGDGKEGREEPDEWDVDGVRPGPGNVLTLGPLGVLHKEVECEEDRRQGEEEEEAVVEKPETDVLLLPTSSVSPKSN